MKRRILIFAVIMALLQTGSVALASDISDALYYGIIRASNTGTLAEYVSANVSINTPSWIAAGTINSTATNVAIRNSTGADTAFMPGYGTNPWVVWYNSVSGNSSVDATLYTNATGGKIRYFPGDNGTTTADSASLEVGGNFTVSQRGWTNTDNGTDKNLINKEDSFRTCVSPTVAGNITSSLITIPFDETLRPDGVGFITDIFGRVPGPTHWECVNDNNDASYVLTNSDTYERDSYTLADSGNTTTIIQSVTLYFRLSNEQAAKITYGIPFFRMGGVYYYGTVQSVTGPAWVTKNQVFNTSPATGVDWTWAEINAMEIGIRLKTSDNAWKAYCSEVYIIVNYSLVYSVSATGISSGEHTVTTTANTTHLWIDIDGDTKDTIPLDAAIAFDNSNNWTSCQNGAMPYMESSNISIGGTLQQSIAWEYGATFTDLSGNNHDATPTFRTTSSDADVTASLIDFAPIQLATTTTDTTQEWPTLMEDPPDEPSTTYSENASPGIFFQPLVHTICTAANIPESLIWYFFAFIHIIAFGMVVYFLFAEKKTQALLIKIIVMGAIMAFFALPGMNFYGLYVLLYFGLYAFGILMLSKDYGW